MFLMEVYCPAYVAPYNSVSSWINQVDKKDLASLKKIIKKRTDSVLNTITFYLEEDNFQEVYFNGETLTFTLELIKI